MDEVTFDNSIPLSFEESRIFYLEGFFIFISLVPRDDILRNSPIVHDDIVELAWFDISFYCLYKINNLHVGCLTALGHRITDVDDLGITRVECLAHTLTEEIGYDTRIEVSRPDDDRVSFDDGLFCTRIEVSRIVLEPGIDDVLIDIVCTFEVIFLGYVNIFFSYDDCPILESDGKMDILESYRYDTTAYVEHISHSIDSLLEVTSGDIYESCEEDIADFVTTDNSLLSLEAIFKKLTYHMCILGKCSDRATKIPRRKYAILITDKSCSTTTICDRYDS